MADHTLIVTLPDGSTATRTTARLYVSAVVYRHTEAEAVAAETELAAARARYGENQARAFGLLVLDYQDARAPRASGWAGYDRAMGKALAHPGFALELVDGLGGAGLVKAASYARAQVGKCGVLTWNQRLELSRDALATERGHHPLRELQVVPTAVVPKATRKAKA